MTNALLVALYARVSSDEQREGQTIQTQRAAFQRWLSFVQLTMPDVRVVQEILDEGVSGTIPLARRPGGARLLELARRGAVNTLVVYKMDRLGRDEWGQIIVSAVKDLDTLGVTVRSITDQVDVTTPAGRQMLNFLAGNAAMERSTLLQRSHDGTTHWAQEGVWLGGIVPFGYRVEGIKKAARLVVSEDKLAGLDMSEADIVRLVFQRIAHEGWTTHRIADHLNALGIPPAYKAREEERAKTAAGRGKRLTKTAGVWLPNRILSMLKNSTYKGVHIYGKRQAKPKEGERPRPARQPISRKVPAIVDELTWERAQKSIAANRLIEPTNVVRRYLLRGKLQCSLCGLAYHGTSSHKAKDGHAYYVCNGKQSYRGRMLGGCKSRSINADFIESEVWSTIEGFLRDPGDVIKQLASSRDTVTTRREALELEQMQVHRLVSGKVGERDAILDLYRRKRIDPEDLDRQLDKIAVEEKALRLRAEEIASQLAAVDITEEQLRNADALLKDLQDKAGALEWETRRQVVEALVLGAVVHTDFDEDGHKTANIQITFAFDRPDERRALVRTGTLADQCATITTTVQV